MTFLISSTGKISLAWGQKWHMPPKFISEWNLEAFLLPLDGMLVDCRVYSHPGFKFAGTIYKTPGDERYGESEASCPHRGSYPDRWILSPNYPTTANPE